MRILFISHTFPLENAPLSNVGGMQRLAVEQEAALAAHRQVELIPLVLRSSSRWTAAWTVPFLVRLLATLPRLVRRERIDVVLFSSLVTASLAPLLRPRLEGSGVVLAATPVGRDVTLPSRLHQWLVPKILGALDLVLPISRATAEECLSRGLPSEKVEIVPCGVDPLRFPRIRDRAAARQELLRSLRESGQAPDRSDGLLLCSVGRHQERKGFHWFVEEVVPRLPDDVVYLLGGTGPMTQTIRSTVDRLGLGERVRVLGQISEATLLSLFQGSDLFVMPNIPVPGDIEGFGVVMLEAGLCGLPIVASDLEGIRDVVRPGENGILVPPGDANGFASAIESFRSEPKRLERASEAAVISTARRFSWEVVVEQYVGALQAAHTASRSDPPEPSRSTIEL